MCSFGTRGNIGFESKIRSAGMFLFTFISMILFLAKLFPSTLPPPPLPSKNEAPKKVGILENNVLFVFLAKNPGG